MVSQNQDGMGWDGSSPSRTGSLLSLEGRQTKTPPSYYEAVRSRHSLSQPRHHEGANKPDGKGQQVKYNSLPRPLPQRYPSSSINGQQQHRPWPDDHYNHVRPNSNSPWRPGDLPTPRQLYESPPKPANHVPLQLQVHNQHDRYLVKRGSEQSESCGPPVAMRPRSTDQARMNNGPRMDQLTVDCNARGIPMNAARKEPLRNSLLCPDVRNVPPGGNFGNPRSPSHNEHTTNSLPRRDANHSSRHLRRCYTATTDGSPIMQSNYPARPPVNGNCGYEPRYSKSGKLNPRPPSHGFESRPMPPPAVQLRTGPLGSYPDPETLKRSELTYNRSFEEYDKKLSQKSPVHSDMSQQIYVDTNSYTNGQSIITDHLAIPYRIPQVSPKNTLPLFDSCNGLEGRKELSPEMTVRGQPSPATNGIKGVKNQLSTCSRSTDDHKNPVDLKVRRHHDGTSRQFSDNLQNYRNQHSAFHDFSKLPPSPGGRNETDMNEDSAIYANHQISFHALGSNDSGLDPRSLHKRTSPMSNGNGIFYDKQLSKANCSREMQDMSHDDTLYANQHIANARFKSNLHSSQHEDIHSPSNFQVNHETTMSNFRNPHSLQKSCPPPTVTQKPRPTLPEPSEMIMITETRGWNGQVNSYSKDVVKPTPRLPRFANIASGTQLVNVPAYQCVINELSNQNTLPTLPRSSDSSTLSLRSGYNSSSSSVRDYGRPPSKSDSSLDVRKLSEGNLRAATSQQCIDKSFLSASMTSLCSDTSSSVSTRRYRHHQEDTNWDRMNEEFQKKKDKGSIFSASPWEREEKEKLQREQLLDARRARDQEIAFLESVSDRSEKQEEWLRILRLEREFQRRAEQEMKDDEEEEEEEDVDIKVPGNEDNNEKVKSFHGDKINMIPSERLSLKLLDELLENSLKNPTLENQEFPKSPEKHFIPLELTIPDRDLPQSSSLPLGSNILQVSDQKMADYSSCSRSSKPPIPAPRPSKTTMTYKPESLVSDHGCEPGLEVVNQNGFDNSAMDLNVRSLAEIEISDTGLYYNEGNNSEREHLQDNWLIEVNSFDNRSDASKLATKHSGEREESRIYENIMDFQSPKYQNSLSQNGFGCHTLPKPSSNVMTKEAPTVKFGSSHFEKKFPAMGISSTLSRKMNGHVPCDNDILPSLYASSKLKCGYQKDIPSDLEDKSPEFKKLWISRPEKLTFQDKIRKFSLQAGEDDVPRDRVKNSRAQREIEIKFNEGQRKIISNSEI